MIRRYGIYSLGTGTLVSSSIAHDSSQVGINAWGDGSVVDRQAPSTPTKPASTRAGAGSVASNNIAYANVTASMAGNSLGGVGQQVVLSNNVAPRQHAARHLRRQ